MGIHYELKNIKGYETLCFETRTVDGQTGEYMKELTEALISTNGTAMTPKQFQARLGSMLYDAAKRELKK